MKKQRSPKKIIIGVTGSFGSGKSTVSGYFKSKDTKIVDADSIAHRIIRDNAGIHRRLTLLFGGGILTRDRQIDRKKLAEVVFRNPDALRKLNQIMHPRIIREIKEEIKNPSYRYIILDAPLLIEAGLKGIVDKLIVVKASRDKQIKMIAQRAGFKRCDILMRIRAQAPLKSKLCLADFVIDNNGTKAKTKKQVQEIRRLLWKS